mgnify:FL=1
MKMITAIVNKKDAGSVCDALMQEGFFFTKMATTGGFLKAGNTTLLIGTEDDKVKAAIEIIRKNWMNYWHRFQKKNDYFFIVAVHHAAVMY